MALFPSTLPLLVALASAVPGAAFAQSAAAASAPAGSAVARNLQNKVWTLQSGSDASGQPISGLSVPGHAFVLRFDARRLAVSGGCNNMSGDWRLDSRGRLAVGRLVSTMKACEPALMAADKALAAVLAQRLAVKLDTAAGQTLQLSSAQQQTLLLAGQPTLESLYGAPTRVFLEVAAQTVPCQPGAGAPTQCLQVRERRFDDKGLRIDPPGEWRAFYGSIEGYTHTPGVRNVLRLKRYQRTQPPADVSSYIHVLDLVVESEVVKS
jgi:heat shock protein HslJ